MDRVLLMIFFSVLAQWLNQIVQKKTFFLIIFFCGKLNVFESFRKVIVFLLEWEYQKGLFWMFWLTFFFSE